MCCVPLTPRSCTSVLADLEVPRHARTQARASTTLRSLSLHDSTYRHCIWLVDDVRSGGMSSDSALPLEGAPSGQAVGRNIYLRPVNTNAHEPFLAPGTLVPTATVPHTLLSGVHLATTPAAHCPQALSRAAPASPSVTSGHSVRVQGIA
jgi:hypothetical protein